MGYRHYLYIIPKETVKDLQGKTYEELWEKYEPQSEKDFYYKMKAEYPDEKKYLSIDSFGQKCVFEFGKLYWDDTAQQIYDTGRPLFDSAEIMEEFEDYNPYIVSKEAIKIAIDIYKKKIVDYYESLFVENEQLCDPFFHIPIKEVEKSIQEKCLEDCQQQLAEWKKDWIFNFDEDKPTLTNSWLYQYSIFNLMHLYKTIDFEKYDLLFYGW